MTMEAVMAKKPNNPSCFAGLDDDVFALVGRIGLGIGLVVEA